MIFYKNAFANNTRKGYTCDANRLSRDAIRRPKRRYVTHKPLRNRLLILHVRTVTEHSTRLRVLQDAINDIADNNIDVTEHSTRLRVLQVVEYGTYKWWHYALQSIRPG